MKYNIDKIRASTGDRVSTTTDLNEVTEAWFDGFSVEVTDNLSSNVYKFCNWDDWCEYADSEARNLQWMDRELKTKLTEDLLEIEQAELRKIEAAVSPSHYKGFVGELQWLEAQQYIIGERKGPEAFKAAVELQIRKYLDRNGGKDRGYKSI